MENWFFIIEKLQEKWEKVFGLIIFLIIIVGLTYVFKNDIPHVSNFKYTHVCIFLSEILICSIFWLFKTNRLLIKSKKYTVALFVNFDNEDGKSEFEIKKIVQRNIAEINSEHPYIRLVRMPYNFRETDNGIVKYLQFYKYVVDIGIIAKLESGTIPTKENKSYHIKIESIRVASRTNQKLNLPKTKLDINKELVIRHSYKDWSFVDSNTFKDKKKISYNLEDSILYYTGICLIYYFKFDEALKILEKLYVPGSNTYETNINGIEISKEQIASGRLANILMSLFFDAASYEYVNNNNSIAAYRYLKKSVELFPYCDVEYYVALARFAYEFGDLTSSKEYTKKVYSLQGEKMCTLLNYGFYAIIEWNIIDLKHYYTKIAHYKNNENYNYCDVVSFLETQKEKPQFADKILLLDFAGAIITRLYIDIRDGNNLIKEFIEKTRDQEKYKPLYEICYYVMKLDKLINESNLSRPRRKNIKKKK